MKRFQLFFLLSFLFFSTHVYAFKFSPMSASIELSDKGGALFYVENDTNQPIAIQLTLAKRAIDEKGIESNPNSGDELSIYPSQLIVQPNEKRSVKVSINSIGVLPKEEAYRLIAEQLPIELQKEKAKKANIKILLRYVAALYITKEEFKSNILVKGLDVQNREIVITIENSGLKHQILANLELLFTHITSKKTLLLRGEELKGMIGENVLAKSSRQFALPKTGKLAEINRDYKVKINFDQN